MKKARMIPFGYTMRNGHLVVDHLEAEIIQSIFTEYINGASLKEIANSLTARSIPYTEKTSVWDKARIARIIDNATYIGNEDYDPIIDENIYRRAVMTKTARQKAVVQRENAAIELLRNRVKCAVCGAPMYRRLVQRKVRENWVCNDPNCGCCARVTDVVLLEKITLAINRIIENSALLEPREKVKYHDSEQVALYQAEIDEEMDRENPSEEVVIAKIGDMATRLYNETEAKKAVAIQIARKRVALMRPTEEFNSTYFSDLVEYITLDQAGNVTLHTKTQADVE